MYDRQLWFLTTSPLSIPAHIILYYTIQVYIFMHENIIIVNIIIMQGGMMETNYMD